MRKVYMQNSHDPANNEWGDCLRACVASLFELEPSVVPHFGENGADGKEMWRRVNEWSMKADQCRTWATVYPGNVDLQDIMDLMQSLNGDAFYMIGGTSNDGGDHIVVAQGNKIVHNPARMSALVGPASDGVYHVVTFVRDFA